MDSLARILLYMLGHKPYEFGLVPDSEGFVSYKELLQALHEEPGWSYVRRSHLSEVFLGKDRLLFEMNEGGIKTREIRWHFSHESPAKPIQKLLFTPVRRRAHAVALEKGLKPGSTPYVVLSSQKNMAARIGRRRDPQPVILEIMAWAAQGEGVLFYPFGDLFLSPEIPGKFVSGPRVPKDLLDSRKPPVTEKERVGSKGIDFMPGTFLLDPRRDPDLSRKSKGKKSRGWKEQTRKMRRRKR